MKQIIRFTVQVTNNISTTVDIPVENLKSENVDVFVKTKIKQSQLFGFLPDLDVDNLNLHGKIIFAWQGWLD